MNGVAVRASAPPDIVADDDADWEPSPFRQCAADPDCGYGARPKSDVCFLHQCIADGEHVSCPGSQAARMARGFQLDLFECAEGG